MRAMKKILLLLVCLVLFASAGLLCYSYYHYSTASQVPVGVIIPKGTGSQETAERLAAGGIISHPHLFLAIAHATGKARQFKAGEYFFAERSTPETVMKKLVDGDVVIHKVTIPEGWSVREVRALLMGDKVLEGDITRPMQEGSVLPETYQFTYGDKRDAIAQRMQAAMDKALAQAWEKRAEGLPLASKEEALVLASIVEKETGVAGERARVAAVFINRLRKGMRLQTDPTVAYGIEIATGAALNRALTTADLEAPTPYNTYVIPGLPPGPIANPGRDAIEATLHPDNTDELYFVATGRGGHNFARTLDEHNRNVAAYRAALRAQ